jgi:hypothetical protein
MIAARNDTLAKRYPTAMGIAAAGLTVVSTTIQEMRATGMAMLRGYAVMLRERNLGDIMALVATATLLIFLGAVLGKVM